jgi:hypothetical protein
MYGYWYSPTLDKAFAQKANALLSSDDIQFHLDKRYNSNRYDWLTEPSETWDELIRDKCLELRENYKYLRLWYSGGEDSHTILDAFIKHKIPLDEIAMFRISLEDFDTCPACVEINDYAAPFLNQNREDLMGAKIKVYDIGYDVFKNYYNVYNIREWNNLNFRVTNNFKWHELGLSGIHDIDGIINIWGIDKPYVNHDEMGFYWFVVDASWMDYMDKAPDSRSVHTLFFINDLKIHAKQVYLALEQITNGKYHYNKVLSPESQLLNCRTPMPGMPGRVLSKASFKTRSSKSLITIKQCLKRTDYRWLYKKYLKEINASGLDKKHFNRENPIFLFKGIKSKKYRIL